LAEAGDSARGGWSSSDELEEPEDGEAEREEKKPEKEMVEPEEEDEEEAEEELEDVEGLLLARLLDRLAGGFTAFTSSTPAAVNR
jgi:hypothetical protein